MSVVRWQFYDPATLETYTFAINPKSGGSPGYEKNFQYENTAGPDGKVLVFQGRDKTRKMTFEGVIFEQDEYDAMVTWFNKRNQIQITDDLGRTYSIIIERFVPQRERAIHYPWKHSYTVDATVVDWT